MQCRQAGEKRQISSSGAGCRVEDRGVAGWWGEGGVKLVVWSWLAWWGEKGGEGLIAISLGEGEGGKTYCLLLVRGASSARAAGAAGASVTAHFDGWVLGGWELGGGLFVWCCG